MSSGDCHSARAIWFGPGIARASAMIRGGSIMWYSMRVVGAAEVVFFTRDLRSRTRFRQK